MIIKIYVTWKSHYFSKTHFTNHWWMYDLLHIYYFIFHMIFMTFVRRLCTLSVSILINDKLFTYGFLWMNIQQSSSEISTDKTNLCMDNMHKYPKKWQIIYLWVSISINAQRSSSEISTNETILCMNNFFLTDLSLSMMQIGKEISVRNQVEGSLKFYIILSYGT